MKQGRELDQDKRQAMIAGLRTFFLEEREEELSEFQASILLDFILDKLGPHIYNQAIENAYSLMADRIEDLHALQKRPR